MAGGIFGALGLGGIGNVMSGIPIVGSILGGNPTQEAHQKMLGSVMRRYEQDRPLRMQAYMDLLARARGAYAPSRAVHAQLFGGNRPGGPPAMPPPSGQGLGGLVGGGPAMGRAMAGRPPGRG